MVDEAYGLGVLSETGRGIEEHFGEERAWKMARLSQAEGIFVLPVVEPAVPAGMSRLRANVTAAHSIDEIDYDVDVFERAGRQVGVLS